MSCSKCCGYSYEDKQGPVCMQLEFYCMESGNKQTNNVIVLNTDKCYEEKQTERQESDGDGRLLSESQISGEVTLSEI